MRNHIKQLLFILCLMITVLASQALAQMFYYPYYGKNKVIYSKFEWDSYKTDHFEIYYYTKNPKTLQTIADMAESAYHRISDKIKHQLSAPVPLIYYKTFTDFQQTNLYQLPEGVLGAAEPLLYRVAMHGDMPADELQNLVEHELTHIFEYDILWGSPGAVLYAVASPPGWVFEGFCEYNTDHWSSWSKLIVRDAVLNDRIPELNQGGHMFSRHPLPRTADYDFGHAMFEFIEHEYGPHGIKNFWQAMKNTPFLGRTNPIMRAFKTDPKEFSQKFKKYLREEHKHFLLRENPEDYSVTMGPEFPMNEYWFAFSHSLSPSGDIIAVVTYNVRDLDLDVLLLSAKDGKVIKNLTKGYTLKYENIKFEIEPSNGRDVTWSTDGDKIAFFARAGQKHALMILDALTGKTLKKINLQQDQPASPCFSPDNTELYFVAFENGIHDIFKVHLETENVLNLTNDDLYEKAVTISPDGEKMVYSIRIDAFDKIFLSPLNDLQDKTQLTFGRGNNITPEFSPDSQEVYFSGDMREAYNIYSVSLESGEIKRYTDVRTGNFYPIPDPNEPNTFVFASFNKGSFQIFRSELEGETEKTVTFAKLDSEEVYKPFEPILTLDIDEKKITPYKGLGKLYMVGRPPVDTIFTTDGSIYGGSALSFSDLFHDHTFTLTAYQVRSFRSYAFSYLNQKKRLQYMATAYQYTLFYYSPYYYMDPTLYYHLSYRDAQVTRKISGANVAAYYPFSLYYRAQAGLSFSNYTEDFYDPYMAQQYAVPNNTNSFQYFWNGNTLALSFALIGETTRFKQYGPAKGNTFRIGITQAIPVSNAWIRNTTLDLDFRHYLYIGGDALFAFRFKGFASRGRNPYLSYYGGNNEVRSANYYSMVGTEGWFANLEFRFPLINISSSLLGPLGPVRGTLFFDMSRVKLGDFPAKVVVLDEDEAGFITGIREVDAIGSYGFGFEFFLFGFPLHLDFVRAVDWPVFSDPMEYNVARGWKTKFWIGFDF